MATTEPPRPQRGRTAEERGSDATAPERELAAAETPRQRFAAAAKPGFLLSQAEGYPPGLKQFIQFCFIVIYPAWLFALVVMGAVYAVVYGTLWVLFSPVRMWMKKNRPEDYAASQAK